MIIKIKNEKYSLGVRKENGKKDLIVQNEFFLILEFVILKLFLSQRFTVIVMTPDVDRNKFVM